jgi:hypothetical protein
MEFINIKLNRYVDVTFFTDLKNNFNYFVDKLTEKGYIHSLLPIDLPQDATYDMPITDIRSLFNSIEKFTYDIDNHTDWINDYSYIVETDGEDVERWLLWDKKQKNKYMLVKRWLDWANYNHSVISGQVEKQQYLQSNIPSDEFPNLTMLEDVYDINGEKIRTLEGYF